MYKEKIKMATLEDVREFVDICTSFECDINIYSGNRMSDAKSISGVLCIAAGKEVMVQAVSSNEDIIVKFINDIKKFEV